MPATPSGRFRVTSEIGPARISLRRLERESLASSVLEAITSNATAKEGPDCTKGYQGRYSLLLDLLDVLKENSETSQDTLPGGAAVTESGYDAMTAGQEAVRCAFAGEGLDEDLETLLQAFDASQELAEEMTRRARSLRHLEELDAARAKEGPYSVWRCFSREWTRGHARDHWHALATTLTAYLVSSSDLVNRASLKESGEGWIDYPPGTWRCQCGKDVMPTKGEITEACAGSSRGIACVECFSENGFKWWTVVPVLEHPAGPKRAKKSVQAKAEAARRYRS